MRYLGVGFLLAGLLISLVYFVRNSREMNQPISIEAHKVRGNPKGPVFLTVFSDFECPFCAEVRHILDDLLKVFPDTLKIVFKHFPLSIHEFAVPAAEASECASDQGQFWAYHDLLFERIEDLYKTKNVNNVFFGLAKELKLNETQFQQCLESGVKKALVTSDKNEGKKFFVSGTPTILLNGKKVMTQNKFDYLKQEIEKSLNNE